MGLARRGYKRYGTRQNVHIMGGIEFNLIYVVVWAGLLLLTLIEVLIPEMSVGPNGPKEMFGISMSRSLSVLC